MFIYTFVLYLRETFLEKNVCFCTQSIKEVSKVSNLKFINKDILELVNLRKEGQILRIQVKNKSHRKNINRIRFARTWQNSRGQKSSLFSQSWTKSQFHKYCDFLQKKIGSYRILGLLKYEIY